MRWAAAVLGVVGGVVGTLSAFAAIGSESSEGAHPDRQWLGSFALACALAAGLGGLLAYRRPKLAAPVLMAGGILGCAAIDLFHTDSYYLVALPFWLLGGVLAHLAPRSPS